MVFSTAGGFIILRLSLINVLSNFADMEYLNYSKV